LRTPQAQALAVPVYIAGQLGGTEGYCEAIRSGLHVALQVAAQLAGAQAPLPPEETAFGALLAHATDAGVVDYQPMHVNFGVFAPLDPPVRNKRERYAAYARRGARALQDYCGQLQQLGLLGGR
ncbi:MAG TPA: methylenetetrahydrofolate--tRNA-(uracil(54)-C(5))-methyltransferase (FADH(2)-oxidizing) TrmFO, partial [Eggerthellaceae bacterium]|nr:methylenetetrahydrofolate--tRNA-(uracil(54)-C(5))-methyltransferase (FADH(2)-oxidizing) TrmFO [Eggerthellaceae bacterium]